MDGGLPVLDPVANYEKIKRIGEGTYGVVCKCQHEAPSFGSLSVSGTLSTTGLQTICLPHR